MMKIASVFRKSWKENIRDWKILILTLAFAPFLVLIMYLFYGGSSQSINIAVLNQDRGIQRLDGTALKAGADLITKFDVYMNTEEGKWVKLIKIDNEEEANQQIKNNQADLLLVIPRDFSTQVLHRRQSGDGAIDLTFRGATTNPKYMMAAALTYSLVNDFVMTAAKITPPLAFKEEFLEKSKPRSDFDYYVPSLIILAVIMVLFTAAAAIIRENDKKTIRRLRISHLTGFEFLTGISLVQLIITEISVLLAYATVLGLGYRPAGSIIDVLIIGLITGLALISISLIVASFLNTIFDLMTIGCFPFFILMFFSGGMFPMPQIKLFTLGDRIIGLNEMIPTTHAITALNKILNFSMGLRDVKFEIISILVLTLIYFIIGLWLFNRRIIKQQA
ncbi:MAG: ABC-2 family transporter protein [Pelotomaculum sp. PtaB.Bin104]|nr:MAG: ABC-2 family transporter protein [Pelotomaculum sp. PtaB.Bin104]